MADRLTQLQDCYDQLATQFYASLRYISLHHNSSPLTPPLPANNSIPIQEHGNQTNNQQNNQPAPTSPTTNVANHQAPPPPQPLSQSQQEPSDPTLLLPPEQRPDSPTTFAAAQRELAHDLILKTKQIEYIISVLPGVENSRERQEERIRELEGELKGALAERERWEETRKSWVERVEGCIGGVRR